jgi:peptide/nickel transport system permease protein
VLPVLTIAGMQAGQLVGGAVVVETIFGWPGIGRLAYEALLQRDYPVLLGIFFICSIMVVIFNLLTELAYRAYDPRVRS